MNVVRLRSFQPVTRSIMAETGVAKPSICIDVTSDTVCPWCFVGKRNLEKAMDAARDRYNFEVKWHPFFLNPNADKKGVDKIEYYKKKFGNERTAAIRDNMAKVFQDLGLSFKLGGLTKVLLEAAAKVGVDGAEEWLNNPNAGIEEIQHDLKQYAAGVTGVPHFLINGRHQLSGAQPPSSFSSIFELASST